LPDEKIPVFPAETYHEFSAAYMMIGGGNVLGSAYLWVDLYDDEEEWISFIYELLLFKTD
jgi:hypothetical protein